MINRHVFKAISKLRTKDLLIAKMDCTKRITLFKSLKLGLLGLLGIFVGQIATSLFTVQADWSWMTVVSIPLALYCAIGYLVLDSLEAGQLAIKELINDLLALRMSKTGKKS